MLFIALSFVSFLCLLVTTVVASISDFRSLKIPNYISIIIVVCFVISSILTPIENMAWWNPLLAALIMFVVSFIMFLLNIMGAGDSKFATALALWLGLSGLPAFVFFMSLFGGVLGVCGLIIRKKKPFKTVISGGWIDQLQSGRNAVPYGIAISFGFVVALWHVEYIQMQFDGIFSLFF